MVGKVDMIDIYDRWIDMKDSYYDSLIGDDDFDGVGTVEYRMCMLM